jgi:hypothetical protein
MAQLLAQQQQHKDKLVEHLHLLTASLPDDMTTVATTTATDEEEKGVYLSLDCLCTIMDFLDTVDVGQMRFACRTWNDIITTRYAPFLLCKIISRKDGQWIGKYWIGGQTTRKWFYTDGGAKFQTAPGELPIFPLPPLSFVRESNVAKHILGGFNEYHATYMTQTVCRLVRDVDVMVRAGTTAEQWQQLDELLVLLTERCVWQADAILQDATAGGPQGRCATTLRSLLPRFTLRCRTVALLYHDLSSLLAPAADATADTTLAPHLYDDITDSSMSLLISVPTATDKHGNGVPDEAFLSRGGNRALYASTTAALAPFTNRARVVPWSQRVLRLLDELGPGAVHALSFCRYLKRDCTQDAAKTRPGIRNGHMVADAMFGALVRAYGVLARDARFLQAALIPPTLYHLHSRRSIQVRRLWFCTDQAAWCISTFHSDDADVMFTASSLHYDSARLASDRLRRDIDGFAVPLIRNIPAHSSALGLHPRTGQVLVGSTASMYCQQAARQLALDVFGAHMLDALITSPSDPATWDTLFRFVSAMYARASSSTSARFLVVAWRRLSAAIEKSDGGRPGVEREGYRFLNAARYMDNGDRHHPLSIARRSLAYVMYACDKQLLSRSMKHIQGLWAAAHLQSRDDGTGIPATGAELADLARYIIDFTKAVKSKVDVGVAAEEDLGELYVSPLWKACIARTKASVLALERKREARAALKRKREEQQGGAKDDEKAAEDEEQEEHVLDLDEQEQEEEREYRRKVPLMRYARTTTAMLHKKLRPCLSEPPIKRRKVAHPGETIITTSTSS